MFTEQARAKINLNLHVGRLVENPSDKYFGYHPLSSLVVFADFGDELSCEVAANTSLQISGPFSNGLEKDENNLILRAYDAVAAKAELPPLLFHLTKNLPLASGIGGGSADAAAALRLMGNFVDLSEKVWLDIALGLGADVPVCYYSQTCVMTGIGENIEIKAGKGQLAAILICPDVRIKDKTKTMFQKFDATRPDIEPYGQSDAKHLLEMAAYGQNDLQFTADELWSAKDLYSHPLWLDDMIFSRMSGAGPTFFVVYCDMKTARAKSVEMQKKSDHGWWIQPVMLGDLP